MAFHLSKTKTIWLDVDRKVKPTIKYVLTALPANTNPIYDVLDIDINEKYPEETLGGDLSVALILSLLYRFDKGHTEIPPQRFFRIFSLMSMSKTS